MGVGVAAMIGVLRFLRGWSLKPLIACSLTPTIALACYMKWGNDELRSILPLAFFLILMIKVALRQNLPQTSFEVQKIWSFFLATSICDSGLLSPRCIKHTRLLTLEPNVTCQRRMITVNPLEWKEQRRGVSSRSKPAIPRIQMLSLKAFSQLFAAQHPFV